MAAAAALLLTPSATTATLLGARTPVPSSRLLRLDVPGDAIALRYPAGRSISITYPANWHVTTRRLDNVTDPHTIAAVTSYLVPKGPHDDCPGTLARGRPPDGVFILVTEILDGASLHRSLPRLGPRPHRFQLPSTGRSGCLPPTSQVFQFRVGNRAFYIWTSVGPRSSAKTRAAAAAVLDRIWIAPYRTKK